MRRLRPRLVSALAALAFASTSGCPSPRAPTGPGPDYEEPPVPSWLDASAPEPETPDTRDAPEVDAPGDAPAAPSPSDAGPGAT